MQQEFFSDFSLGFLDGLTVTSSISSGLFAGNIDKESILKSIIASTSAGSLSMGLSNYLSIDVIDSRKDDAFLSGLRTSFGYIIGAALSFVAFKLNESVKDGFQYSILSNCIALLVFGFLRGYYLTENPFLSIVKVFLIGVISMSVTFYVGMQ